MVWLRCPSCCYSFSFSQASLGSAACPQCGIDLRRHYFEGRSPEDAETFVITENERLRKLKSQKDRRKRAESRQPPAGVTRPASGLEHGSAWSEDILALIVSSVCILGIIGYNWIRHTTKPVPETPTYQEEDTSSARTRPNFHKRARSSPANALRNSSGTLFQRLLDDRRCFTQACRKRATRFAVQASHQGGESSYFAYAYCDEHVHLALNWDGVSISNWLGASIPTCTYEAKEIRPDQLDRNSFATYQKLLEKFQPAEFFRMEVRGN